VLIELQSLSRRTIARALRIGCGDSRKKPVLASADETQRW
jgi:hypothetical protein